MVEIAITSIICVTILLVILMFAVRDYIEGHANAQVAIMKQKQIADDRVHDRWKELLELEAKLSAPVIPAVPVAPEVELAQIELAKIEAEARTLEASVAEKKASLEYKKYTDSYAHRRMY